MNTQHKPQKVQRIKKPVLARPGLTKDTFAPQKLSKRQPAVHFDTTSSPGQITTTLVRAPVQRPQSTRPDVAALGRKKITFVRVLKGDEKKISCMVDIDGRTYVVKGGDGNAYIEDHVAHSDLFHKLTVPGLAAPGVVKLSTDFLQTLDGELAKQQDPQVGLLRKALAKNQQIAATAPGLTVESILEDHTVTTQMVGKVRGKTDADALKLLIAEITLSNTPSPQQRTMLQNAKQSDQPLTLGQLQALQLTFVSAKNQAILALALDVHQRGAQQTVTDQDAKLTQLQRARQVLLDRVKTKDGATSLGAMCAMDLLCGMGDRVLGDWNGGNFMFDPDKNDFWAVDNAKTDFGLTGLIAPRSQADEQDPNIRWRTWLLGNGMLDGKDGPEDAASRMHTLLYHTDRKDGDLFHTVKLSDEEETATSEGVADGFAMTIDKLRKLVNDGGSDLPPHVRKNLKERLAFVDQKAAFTSAATFDAEFDEIPSVTKAKKLEKGARVLKRRTELEVQAKTLKDDARSGRLTTDQLVQREHALLQAQYQEKISDTDRDRRLDKALFEAKLARLLLDVGDRTQALLRLSRPLTLNTDVEKDSFRKGLKPWEDELRKLGDKDGVRKLQAAQAGLEKAIDTLV